MTCAICNKFQGRWKINTLAESHGRLQEHRHHVVPRFTWDDILASAKSCYCCRILESGCRGCFEQHGIRESDVLHGGLDFLYPHHIEAVEEMGSDKNLAFRLVDGRQFVVEMFVIEDDDCPVPDLWDYFPTLGRTSPRTDSRMALDTIKSWISECITTHPTPESFCDSPDHPYLPTRVVDVGLGDKIVKLVEPKGAKGNYVCLSHCWGLAQIITTTRLTFEEHKRGIAWEDLPKTFQDAISLTRNLGFDYIWIDSLCIIQDDSFDWEVESAKMASVYGNGYLTIAATHSANGNGGLFSRTEDYEVCGKTPGGEDYCLYFREKIDHHIDMIDSTVTHYPLLTRAWVYQERMLSTRVLHFGRYEIFYECSSAIRCECGSIEFHGFDGTETLAPLIKVEYADTLWNYRDGDKAQINSKVRYQCARLWRTMVCCYTALFLTKSTDRLPAISGLAKQLAAGTKSRYLAGLWEETLHDDLLWTVYETSKVKKPRPHPKTAPTWSWASVGSCVHYWDIIVFTDPDDEGFEEPPPYQHFSVIEKCEVHPSTAIDEFGSLAHGSLTISGLVAEGILEREVNIYDDGAERINHYVSFPNALRLLIRTDYLLDHDSPGQTKPMTPVFCLRMSLIPSGLIPSGQKEHLVSLVLKRSLAYRSCFERIGTLVVSGSLGSVGEKGDVFRAAEVRTVTIV